MKNLPRLGYFCIKNNKGVYKIHFNGYNLILKPTHFEL